LQKWYCKSGIAKVVNLCTKNNTEIAIRSSAFFSLFFIAFAQKKEKEKQTNFFEALTETRKIHLLIKIRRTT